MKVLEQGAAFMKLHNLQLEQLVQITCPPPQRSEVQVIPTLIVRDRRWEASEGLHTCYYIKDQNSEKLYDHFDMTQQYQ